MNDMMSKRMKCFEGVPRTIIMVQVVSLGVCGGTFEISCLNLAGESFDLSLASEGDKCSVWHFRELLSEKTCSMANYGRFFF